MAGISGQSLEFIAQQEFIFVKYLHRIQVTFSSIDGLGTCCFFAWWLIVGVYPGHVASGFTLCSVSFVGHSGALQALPV